MPTMNLPPEIFQQFFDDNGAPLAGGSLYTYQAGTTTPQATYTDQSGGTANANPIVLDASGRCAMWLDPSLSYKFVLKDSGGTTIKTVDNVVGLLSDNSVPTAAIQDGAVTSAKLAAGAVDSTALKSDSSIDANRPVNTNNIRDGAITTAKIANGAITNDKLAFRGVPTVQKFTSGSGTYNKTYQFIVGSASATAGANYTNNGITYTVSETLASGSILVCTGSGDPDPSGTLTLASGTGDSTITYSQVVTPLYLRVRAVGGGGGGAGGGASGGSGSSGGDTTFGILITCNGGGGGAGGSSSGVAGSGGGVTLDSSLKGISITGSGGCPGFLSNSSYAKISGGTGGNSPFGGAGKGADVNSGAAKNAESAAANSGSGGGGSNNINQTATYSGGGGGAGGYADVFIYSPSSTYDYAVGAKGSGGTAGTGGTSGTGGDGGDGLIIVEEYYQ